MSDDPALQLHHKIQLGDEGGVPSQAMEHIVLQAAGAIDIPEALPDQFLHLTAVVAGFVADGDAHCFISFLIVLIQKRNVTISKVLFFEQQFS